MSGRLAGVLFMGGGLLSALTALLPQPPQSDRSIFLLFSIIGTLTGAVVFLLPWERWRRRWTLVLPVLGLGFVSVGNWLDRGQPYILGVYFVVVFVWIGVTQPRGTSLVFALPAAIAYILSILAVPTSPDAEATSAVFVIPVSALLGESLAWLVERLARSEEALEKERALMGVMQSTAVAANQATTVEDALRRCLDLCVHSPGGRSGTPSS